MLGGTYAKEATPDFWNAGSQRPERDAPSGLVKMSVRTSLGFAFRKVLTFSR